MVQQSFNTRIPAKQLIGSGSEALCWFFKDLEMAYMEVVGALCCSVVFTAALGGVLEVVFWVLDKE